MNELLAYGPESPDEQKERLERKYPGLNAAINQVLFAYYPPPGMTNEIWREFPVVAAVLRPTTDLIDGKENHSVKIIASNGNLVKASNDPTAHAEVNVIREACKILDTDNLPEDCILFSTHPPCAMCADAFYYANGRMLIHSLSFSDLRTDNNNVIGGDYKRFKAEPISHNLYVFYEDRQHPITVEAGYMRDSVKDYLFKIDNRQDKLSQRI